MSYYTNTDVRRCAKTLSGTSEELAARLRTMLETAVPKKPGEKFAFVVERAALSYVLRERFAERHGWRYTQKGFSPKTLAYRRVSSASDFAEPWPLSVADHAYYFRTPDRRAAAVAAHLYWSPDRREEAEAWAREVRLRVEFPIDFPSWWFPGHTELCVYTSLA
jgi:hypothetical protein